MLQILFCWIYILLTSTVIGHSLFRLGSRWFHYDHKDLHPVLVSCAGMFVLMLGLGFWSLWYPVGMAVHAIVAAVAVLIIIVTKGRCLQLNLDRPLPAWPVRIALAATVLLLLFKTAQGITTPDSAGYHLPFIKWIEHYKVIPGLANVHSRFGFNYQYHLLCAFYGCAFLSGDTIHALNGYIQCAVLLYLLSSLTFVRKGMLTRSGIAKCLIALVVLNMSNAASSFSPDFPVSGICILVFMLLFEKAERNVLYAWDAEAFAICLLSITAVLFKISAAPVFLCALLFLAVLLRGRQWKVVAGLVILFGVSVIPYLLRNYFISGYLVYPLYSLDILHPDWKLPYDKVVYEKEVIHSYALGLPYGQPFTFKESMISWYHYLRVINSTYLSIAGTLAVCILLNIAWLLRQWFRAPLIARYWTPGFVILYLALIYWFFNAPDPRFGNGYILPFIALTLSVYAFPVFNRKGGRLVLPGICTLLVLLVALQLRGKSVSVVSKNFGRTKSWYWQRQAPYPAPDTVITIYEKGMKSYRVSDTGYCWQAPQPCTVCADSFHFRGTVITDGFLPGRKRDQPQK